jgi:hypothetical protein
MLLFKDGVIYQYTGASEFTKDSLLHYLSADNHINLSLVWAEDMQEWLQTKLRGGQFSFLSANFYQKTETKITDKAKDIFKRLNLHHWNINSKVFMTLICFMLPLCGIITVLIAWCIAFVYNSLTKFFYQRKMDRLKDYEKEVLMQIE